MVWQGKVTFPCQELMYWLQWPSADGALLGVNEEFTLDLAEGSVSIGVCSLGLDLALGTSLALSFCFPGYFELQSLCHMLLMLWHSASLQVQKSETKWPWSETSETVD